MRAYIFMCNILTVFSVHYLVLIFLQALERAMKFSYEEPHVWYQFALSLIETGKVCTMYT